MKKILYYQVLLLVSCTSVGTTNYSSDENQEKAVDTVEQIAVADTLNFKKFISVDSIYSIEYPPKGWDIGDNLEYKMDYLGFGLMDTMDNLNRITLFIYPNKFNSFEQYILNEMKTSEVLNNHEEYETYNFGEYVCVKIKERGEVYFMKGNDKYVEVFSYSGGEIFDSSDFSTVEKIIGSYEVLNEKEIFNFYNIDE